jgi:hypothetical protein
MGQKKLKPKARSERRLTKPPSGVRPSVRPPSPIETMPVPPPPTGRKLGARGAAPWAARHAERRAAEAAARLREPPRPGSARATLRTPAEADRIKARIGELHAALGRVRALRKNLDDGFFELGRVLKQIADDRLFDEKGYATFEAFVDREVDLSKGVALRLARVPEVFQERAARAHGLDAVLAALDVLEEAAKKPLPRKPSGPGRGTLPLKPPR